MSDEQWRNWIAIVEKGNGAIIDTLHPLPMQNELLVATALSCAKWHPLRGARRGGLMATDCGLCVMYFRRIGLDRKQVICHGCPLNTTKLNCLVEGSPFQQWKANPCAKTADKMYRTLMRVYNELHELAGIKASKEPAK